MSKLPCISGLCCMHIQIFAYARNTQQKFYLALSSCSNQPKGICTVNDKRSLLSKYNVSVGQDFYIS